jgi:hypothetical protein
MFSLTNLPEIDFDDPGTVEGQTAADVEAAIPQGWIASPAKTGLGKRYADPSRPGEQIRVMTGDLADPEPVKRGPYVRISKSGKVSDPIPLAGNHTLRTGTP